VISFSVLIRVGAASSPEEIAAWPDVDYNKKAKSWARLLNLMLDPLQGAYRSEDVSAALLHPEPNDLWQRVSHAFVEEGGMAVLASHLDASAFDGLAADKPAEASHLTTCILARVVRRSLALGLGTCDDVAAAAARLSQLSTGAAAWLRPRLNSAPDKLTGTTKAKDAELLDCIIVSANGGDSRVAGKNHS